MERQVTEEERKILLENPELVMFEPYRAVKIHRCSLGLALIPPAITAVLIFLFGIAFPKALESHPNLFAGSAVTLLTLACASIPVLFFYLDDRAYKKRREAHYKDQLTELLPKKLWCKIVTIKYIVREKAEGAFIEDGKEQFFGYASCVNIFKMEPSQEVAFVYDGKSFFAFIKRDMKTESLYRENESEVK